MILGLAPLFSNLSISVAEVAHSANMTTSTSRLRAKLVTKCCRGCRLRFQKTKVIKAPHRSHPVGSREIIVSEHVEFVNVGSFSPVTTATGPAFPPPSLTLSDRVCMPTRHSSRVV